MDTPNSPSVDRRELLVTLFGMACMALTPAARAQAQKPLTEQPWAVYDDKEKPVRGGVYRLAWPTYIGMLNPNHWPVTDWLSIAHVHEKLMITDGSYRPVVYWLAESLVQESPTSVLMTLRDGVQFQDGTALTAENVQQQIAWITKSDSTAWSKSMLSNLAKVDVTGPRQLRWTFKQPWAAFNGVMANVPGYALSMTALNKDEKKFDTQPVGVGAFIVEEASPGNYLKLKRNPNWWFAKAIGRPDMPYFDGIQISVIPDPGVRLANFRAGRLDALTLDKSQYAMLKGDKRASVHVQPLPTTVGMRFNSEQGVFTDIRLRKAVLHAINQRALIAGTQHGLGRPATGLYPNDHWAYNPSLKAPEYNPQLAKKLLAEAGYEKGLTITGFFGNTPAQQTVAEAIKGMLAQVGVTWRVELLAAVAGTERLREGRFDLAEGGWTYIYDPDLTATGLYHPSGAFSMGRRKDPELVALIEAARNELDYDKRMAAYRELGRRVNEQCLDVWLWWEEQATAYQNYVRGYDPVLHRRDKEVYLRSHQYWFADGKPGRVA